MQQIKRFYFLALVLISSNTFAQTEQADTTRILFIGNSYTYFNELPDQVLALAQEKYPNQVIETAKVTRGGMTLQRHWNDGNALEVIKTGNWDYIVLQEQSKLGMAIMIENDIYFGNTDLFWAYARKFDSEIKQAGAETVFFMPWSVRDRPEEQAIVTHAYTTIAKELGATLAPVGLVWEQLRQSDQFDLYVRDGSHPSPMGSYVAATTIFATIFQDSPAGLSGKLARKTIIDANTPPPPPQVLVDLPSQEAMLIQLASWYMVESLQKTGGYPSVEKPSPNYAIPVLGKGEPMKLKKTKGRWYGTSSYGSGYLGLVLDVNDNGGEPAVNVAFYSPHQRDQMIVQSATLKDDLLELTMYDSLRTMSSTIQFILNENQLLGLLYAKGALEMYKTVNLSRESVQDDIDLEAYASLMQEFQTEIASQGYVKAAIAHYERYSQLIGKTYLPEERYLNANGYNYLREKKVDKALEQFELNMTLYPESVNAYDSYAEGLVIAGQKEKALGIYKKAVTLAKATNDENLAYIEANMKKLQEDMK